MTSSPGSKLALRALLFVAALAVALAAGELVARWMFDRGPKTREELGEALERSRQRAGDTGAWVGVGDISELGPTPDVVYQLRPNLRGTFKGQPFATNLWGIRGEELELAKPPGTIRIVGLGDSHLFGWGVGQEETYFARTARALAAEAAPGRRFEMINCGVPGYNTTLEVAFYESKCSSFAPDLVVLHVIGNDLNWPHFVRLGNEEPRGSVLLALLRAVVLGENEGSDEEPPKQLFRERKSTDPARQAALDGYRDQVGAKASARALRRLADLTRASGIEVVVLSLGGGGGPARDFLLPRAERLGFAVVDASPRFARLLEERGLPADRESWRAAFQIPDDGHPSVLAHEAYSRVLLDEIRARFPDALRSPVGVVASKAPPEGAPGS